MDQAKNTERLEILDALRGFAAMAVVLAHLIGSHVTEQAASVAKYGGLGVDVFFVISGFIIPYSLMNSKYHFSSDYGRFLAKRYLRLYPPFILALLLTLVLHYISARIPGFRGAAPEWTVGNLLINALLLGDILGVPWVLGVVWTLAIEFQYYLLAGVVTPVLKMGKSAGLGMCLFLLVLSWLPLEHGTIFQFLPLFVIGIVVALYRYKKFGVGFLSVALLLAVFVCWDRLGVSRALAGVGTGLAIAFYRGKVCRPLIVLGAASYSLYLLHVPLGVRVVLLSQRLGMDSLWEKVLAVLFGVLFSVICAWFWFRWIELPSHRLAQKIRYKGSD